MQTGESAGNPPMMQNGNATAFDYRQFTNGACIGIRWECRRLTPHARIVWWRDCLRRGCWVLRRLARKQFLFAAGLTQVGQIPRCGGRVGLGPRSIRVSPESWSCSTFFISCYGNRAGALPGAWHLRAILQSGTVYSPSLLCPYFAACTIATMPARIADGRCCQAAMNWAKSGGRSAATLTASGRCSQRAVRALGIPEGA
jgi:hypothetical protein